MLTIEKEPHGQHDLEHLGEKIHPVDAGEKKPFRAQAGQADAHRSGGQPEQPGDGQRRMLPGRAMANKETASPPTGRRVPD